MTLPTSLSSDTAHTVVEYMSADSPTVTSMRGSVLVATFHALKEAGHFDRYLTFLTPDVRDELANVLAASWVTTPLALEHCRAGEALSLSARELHDLGRLAADRMGESTFSTIWRGAQAMGVGSGWWVMKQADRMWTRLYIGGGCTVRQLGPKDSLFEARGVPMLESRFFRALHHGFMIGVGRLLGSTCYVKPEVSRVSHPHRVAISFSWV